MSIDYTNYSNDSYLENDNDFVVDEISNEEVMEESSEDEVLMGKIYNTEKVYVRSEPKVADGNDVTILDKGSEILISDISGDWCKVCTATGIEGYVMKKFVNIG